MRSFFAFISMMFFQASLAQSQDNQTLFKIEDKEISVAEFNRTFNDNAALALDENKRDFEDNFDLFLNFHLKLKAAEDAEIDQEADFLKEFNQHFTQLADNYIANGKVTDEMIQETYQRLKTEVKASHILIRFDKNSDQAKEKALQKIDSIIRKIDAGEDFESLAVQYSQDPSVKENKGDMGWFKAFKMVYPFEDAVYRLEVDEISAPVETRFGFHIIKKTGERPSVGKMIAAHILIVPESESDLAKNHIDNIYEMLLNGEDFYDLAKQFSQDKATAENGGKMPPFEVGSVNSKVFEEVVFGLENDGDISKPFKTRFGWHIVKRIGTKPIKSFDDKKEELRKKIKTSSRSRNLNKRIEEYIRTFYKVEEDDQASEFFLLKAGEEIGNNKWKVPEKINFPNRDFLVIDDKKFSYEDLAKYIEKNQLNTSIKKTSVKIKKLINDFVYEKLINHHKNYLAELDEEFNASLYDYRNGLLLFEVMNRNVWQNSETDSIKLRKFYEEHKSNYVSPIQFTADLASFISQEEAEQFRKKWTEELTIEEKHKSEAASLLFEANKQFKIDDITVPEEIKLERGISETYFHNNRFLVFNIKEIDQAKQKRFEAVRGKVIADYQDWLEEKWISELKKKYTIEYNDEAINQTKKSFE
ncbi:MAG: peptidylprolyl isomerase [Bacteroidota bacterium]